MGLHSEADGVKSYKSPFLFLETTAEVEAEVSPQGPFSGCSGASDHIT